MIRITWKAETQSESFPFADEKSRPLGSSSHQPPKLKQIFVFKVRSIYRVNYFSKLKILNVRNLFANEKSGLAGWYHLAPLPPKLKQSWLETLEERAGCNWKWELPSRAAARAQKKEALKAHKKKHKKKTRMSNVVYTLSCVKSRWCISCIKLPELLFFNIWSSQNCLLL